MSAAQPDELRAPAPAAALAAWARACDAPMPGPPETVPVEAALGRVVHAAVRARRSSPAHPAAAMDGIAVRASALAGASDDVPARLRGDDYVVVDTGDPLPPAFDAVVPRERVERSGPTAVVRAPSPRGKHVRAVGEDVAAGELLFAPGHRLGPVDLALLAAAGHAELAVAARPVVSILPTGDEVRPAGAELGRGEVADTNSVMLEAQAREAGCRILRRGIEPDDPDRLTAAVRRAAGESDLVLFVAGTSAGRADHGPDVLRRCGRVVVSGVAMRPGHPAVLAVVDGTPVMGCPGYPVSAALAFEELARPLLERMLGVPSGRDAVPARLAAASRSRRGAEEHLRVALGAVGGERVAVPLPRGASVLSGLARADGLVTVAPEAPELPVGATVSVRPFGARPAVPRDLLIAGPPDRGLELVLLACAARGLSAGFCELDPDAALALLAAGGCHAAWWDADADAAEPDASPGRPFAERDVGLAFAPGNPLAIGSPADLERPGVRAVAAPAGWAAAPRLPRARSDDAAVAAVAGGSADVAVAGLPAARAAGLATLPTGRAQSRIALRSGAGEKEAAVRTLLDVLSGPELAAALDAAGYAPPSAVGSPA